MGMGRLAFMAILIAFTMLVTPALPLGASGPEYRRFARSSVIDDSNDLIVPAGEVYELGGCHTYARSIVINGTLKVKPYNGTNGTSGTLTLIGKSILVGIDGIIMADGRGYGGGGGACANHLPGHSAGGANGSGGPGGAGESHSGGGGGGSNGGPGGIGGGLGGGVGANGNEDHGGNGGDESKGGGYYGDGGQGYGGGGGGGGGYDGDLPVAQGPGGGGGGGSGGSPPVQVWLLGSIGGHGAGPAGGEGGDNITYPWPCDGCNGGYHVAGANGDNTTDASIDMGSGGGGGGMLDRGGGASGGGGAGGGSVALISEGNLIIEGSVSAIGGGGGSGGREPSIYLSGGMGGGGGGGGVMLYGREVIVPGRIDVRGREGNGISSVNGGTVKIFYETNKTIGTIRAGRIYSNGRPLMQGLSNPMDNGSTLLRPEFRWWSAVDPEGDNIRYQIQVATVPDFKTRLVDVDGLRMYNFTLSIDLLGKEFFWRVRAADAIGYGNWSETRRFHNDITPPVTAMNPLPVFVNRTSLLVSWTGSDDMSGIAKYRIYIAEGESPFRVWLYDVNNTSAVYENAKDGVKYSFFSVGIDRAGNNESARMVADACTTVDWTPPVSSIDSVSYGDDPGELVVKWSGVDSISGIRHYNVFISEEGKDFSIWQSATMNTTGSILGEDGGNYSFFCLACDNAGNMENMTNDSKILGLRADNGAPDTTLWLTGPMYGEEPTYITMTTIFSLNGTDDCSGVKETWYILDDGEPKYYLSSFTEKGMGVHNLKYWSVDLAGNAEEPKRFVFSVDNEPPETTVDFGGSNLSAPGKIYVARNNSIIIYAKDNSSGVNRIEYNLDSHGYTNYTRPFILDLAGKHSLLYRSTDNVGNKEVEKSIQIIVDILPPVTKAESDALLSNMDIRISFNSKDNESGVIGTYYRIAREKERPGDFQLGSEAVITAEKDHSSDANYSIQYYSVDKLGNVEPVGEVKVKIDTQVFLQLGFKGIPKVSVDRYSIQGKTEPGVRMSINDEVVLLSSDGGFSYDMGLVPGRNRATINIIDLAGNTITKTVYVDYEKPANSTGWLIVGVIIAVVAGILAAGGFIVAIRKKRIIKGKKKGRTGNTRSQGQPRRKSA